MSIQQSESLRALYHDDETAWLDAMARLAAERRVDELDLESLSEYLHDMARRDRREVFSRLVVLMMHLLKWEHQPKKRSRSWRGTILQQRLELKLDLEGATLRNYAEEVLLDAYRHAVWRASAETGLRVESFPAVCPFTLDEILTDE